MAETIRYPSTVNFVFDGDVDLNGTGSVPDNSVTNNSVSSTAGIARTKLEQNTNVPFVIPMYAWRVHDQPDSNLSFTGSAGDEHLSLLGSTYGTDVWYISTGDVASSGTETTAYARTQFALPSEYDPGETITVRVYCGMLTTIADQSCTVDVEVVKLGTDKTPGADIVSTAAQSINSLTWGNKDFSVSSSGITVGDVLDIRLSVVYHDDATATAVEAGISKVAVLLDIRG